MELLDHALRYCRSGFSVIVLKPESKEPLVPWERYQKEKAEKEIITSWFSSEENNNNLALVTGRVSAIFAFDIDGEDAKKRFERIIERIEDEAIKNGINNTMCIRTGSGNFNVIVGFDPEEFLDIDGIRNSVLWRGKDGHTEIRLKGEGGYVVAPPSTHPNGNKYEIVKEVAPAVLTKEQVRRLIAAFGDGAGKFPRSSYSQISRNTICEVSNEDVLYTISLLKPYYQHGVRNDFILYLSGWLWKEGIGIESAFKIVEGIAEGDEEKVARLRTLEQTYSKTDVDAVSGYSGLLSVLTVQLQDIERSRNVLHSVGSVFPHNQRKGRNHDQKQDTKSLVEEASEAIMSKNRLMTIQETKDMLHYRNGVYVPGGEIVIEKEAEKMYRYKLSNTHLSEIKGHITRSTYHTRDEIDSDLDIINLKNGLYNLRTGEFIEHTADYLSVIQAPILYNPKARPKLFGKYLREVLYPGEIRTAIELLGYTFYRANPFEIIAILFGYGANGKGVFTGLLTSLHGSKNISNVPLSSMFEDRFALSDLEGKAVNIDTELKGATIRDASILKKLTGRQPTRIQRKNQQAYDSPLYAKLFFSANKIPETYDESDAFFRRKVILGFPNSFEGSKDDPDLIKKLTTEEELSGIFNVLMIALRRLLSGNNIFVKERTMEQRRERYILATSPIEAFLEDAVAEDSVESDEVTKERLYQAYKRFCIHHSLAVLSKETFGKVLKRPVGKWKLGESREASGERRTLWTGVKLAQKYNIELRQQTLNV